ncbi:MAG: chorismate synthase, partial [Chloroflexi bacterium]|nr:chorismate synthase [Chloroflexota bacterium]
MLRFLTAGESHGPGLTVILDGFPAGLALSIEEINRDLARRQGGYGRGGRQQIERDEVQILGGVVQGKTIGAPLGMFIVNRDYENWRDRPIPKWVRPRPGHADLAGASKYRLDDLRLVAERASARETAARVAAGAVAKQLLRQAGIVVGSYVEAIGGEAASVEAMPLEERLALALSSDVSCPDEAAATRMRQRIEAARSAGDSLGGILVVIALGLPVGLGSYVQWDRRLDGRLAQAVMSIPAIKGVEIGPAFENAALPGTAVHDAL